MNAHHPERPAALSAASGGDPRDRVGMLTELIREAESDGPLRELAGVEGLSGRAVIGTLQRFANALGGDYLEVGVYRGYTLLSVASVLRGTAVGVDNFSQFDPDHGNRAAFYSAARTHGLQNVSLVDLDYEAAFDVAPEVRERKFQLYFIDGPHDYRSQLMCMVLALPHLTDDAVIVVDDCNYEHVRQANRDFLRTHPEFALLFEAYTAAHPRNLVGQQEGVIRRGWWNGINVIVRDRNGVVPRAYPPTNSDRTRFLNDHLIHGARYGKLAVGGLELLQTVWDRGLLVGMFRMVRIWRKKPPANERERYRFMNTFSDQLPISRFHFLSR